MNLKSFFSFLICYTVVAQALQAQTLPNESLLHFSIRDSVTVYKGDDLFFLIDGGAEVYLEYGFVKVMAADYSKDGQSIHVELYEMESKDAAWGIYSLRKPNMSSGNTQGRSIAQAKDYLMAYYQNHYLLVSGVCDSLLLTKIALAILPDLNSESYKPMLVNKLDQKQEERIVYAKGPIALSNVYQFGYGMIASFAEACAMQQQGSLLIMIKYTTEQEALASYTSFISKARASERYQLKSESEHTIVFTNKQNNLIQIQQPEGNLLEFRIMNR
jgi:hypothetical protein